MVNANVTVEVVGLVFMSFSHVSSLFALSQQNLVSNGCENHKLLKDISDELTSIIQAFLLDLTQIIMFLYAYLNFQLPKLSLKCMHVAGLNKNGRCEMMTSQF